MHGSWRRLRDPDQALAYLRRSVVNGSRSALRHRTVVQRHAPAPLPDDASRRARRHGGPRNARTLTARCDLLPRRQREVLVLRYYVDLSEAQIADAIGISRGAVKSHASRGMAALRHQPWRPPDEHELRRMTLTAQRRRPARDAASARTQLGGSHGQPAGDGLQKIRVGIDARRHRVRGGATRPLALVAAAVLGVAGVVAYFGSRDNGTTTLPPGTSTSPSVTSSGTSSPTSATSEPTDPSPSGTTPPSGTAGGSTSTTPRRR